MPAFCQIELQVNGIVMRVDHVAVLAGWNHMRYFDVQEASALIGRPLQAGDRIDVIVSFLPLPEVEGG